MPVYQQLLLEETGPEADKHENNREYNRELEKAQLKTAPGPEDRIVFAAHSPAKAVALGLKQDEANQENA